MHIQLIPYVIFTFSIVEETWRLFLSIEQRVFMVVTYCATGSSNQVQGLFRSEFPRNRVPYRSTIIRNVDKYLEYGVSTNRRKDASDRRRTVRSIQNIQEVPALQDDPNITARRNNCPNISKTSFNRITKIDLRWHPYRIQICRYAISYVKEMWKDESSTYNQWLLGKPQAFMSQIIIGDEAIFQLKTGMSLITTLSVMHPVVIHLKTLSRQTLFWRKACCMDRVSEEQPDWVVIFWRERQWPGLFGDA